MVVSFLMVLVSLIVACPSVSLSLETSADELVPYAREALNLKVEKLRQEESDETCSIISGPLYLAQVVPIRPPGGVVRPSYYKRYLPSFVQFYASIERQCRNKISEKMQCSLIIEPKENEPAWDLMSLKLDCEMLN